MAQWGPLTAIYPHGPTWEIHQRDYTIVINYYAHIEKGGQNPSFEVIKGLAAALKVKSSSILPF